MDKHEKAQKNLEGRCLRCNFVVKNHGHHNACPDRPKTEQEKLIEKLKDLVDEIIVDDDYFL